MQRAALVLVLALASSLVLVACGGEDEPPTAGSGTAQAQGNEVDRAFVAEMVMHHEGAIAMAQIAEERGQSQFVKGLADDILRTQKAELGVMRRIDAELDRAGVVVGDLGMEDHAMGMESDPEALREAEPFDRAFVDAMVPHHEGAVAMARVQLERGTHPALNELAEAIIEAQQREIEEMNAFRQRQYGAPVPDAEGHG